MTICDAVPADDVDCGLPCFGAGAVSLLFLDFLRLFSSEPRNFALAYLLLVVGCVVGRMWLISRVRVFLAHGEREAYSWPLSLIVS